MMAAGFGARIRLYLHFIPAAEIYTAVGFSPAVEFNVEFEILEFLGVDQVGPIAIFHQRPVHNLP